MIRVLGYSIDKSAWAYSGLLVRGRLLCKADIHAETRGMGRNLLCKVLGESLLIIGNNRSKGPKAGKDCSYLMDKKETSMTES